MDAVNPYFKEELSEINEVNPFFKAELCKDGRSQSLFQSVTFSDNRIQSIKKATCIWLLFFVLYVLKLLYQLERMLNSIGFNHYYISSVSN